MRVADEVVKCSDEGTVVEDNSVIGDPDGEVQVYGKTILSI